MSAFHRAAVGFAVVFVLVLASATSPSAQQPPEGRLLRFPDVHGTQVVFSYAGDLWLTTTDGGVARRITTSPGLELFPHFSPDGKWIAFTGQYDGNFNVYVIPAEGGQPRQLTFVPDIGLIPERMGPNNEVIAWTPDSKRIVFLSRRDTFNDWFGLLWTVSVDGGLPERLPIDRGGLLAFNSDGSEMIYNRIFRNFRTWKRYTGGMAQKLSLWNFKTHQYEQLTNDEWTDTFPMWKGGAVYFASDRGAEHRLNLYSMDLASRAVRQLTHYKDFDVEWPSLNGDRIIFENSGWLYLFDTKAERTSKLTVQIEGDFDQAPKALGFHGEADRLRRSIAGRQARRFHGSRRCVHGSRRPRRHAQPDRDPRHPRAKCRVVSRWPLGRLHQRSHRRADALHSAAGRHGRRAADHQRRTGIPDAAGLVSR